MNFNRIAIILLTAATIAGCASDGRRAPVMEGGARASNATAKAAQKVVQGEKDWRPDVYVVQKGDTLYSIAFNYGFDYHELAELNRIADPTLISIGQEIHLFPPSGNPPSATETKPEEILVKDQPKLVKYAYSEQAMALIDKVQSQPSSSAPIAIAEVKPAPRVASAPAKKVIVAETDASKMVWEMPTKGKLISGFSETANRKGIDIAGTLGQPIIASASGKVVYSGSGLRGYGKLIIIKHNSTYLSAYAHNDKILVKEGDSVTRGQKIAAMGKTDSDRVKLHFEVRRLGKPVDPAEYLQLADS